MTENFLQHKDAKTNDYQDMAAFGPLQKCAPYTLLVYPKLSYTHETHYLTKKQVNDLFWLAANAHEEGKSLNRFITIHLKDLKIKTAQICLSKLMEKTRKWLQRNGFDHAHIWVLENGDFKGLHAHILVHIPNYFIQEYKRLLKKWLPPGNGENLDVQTIKYSQWGQLGGDSCVLGILRYMCKGIDPATPAQGIKPEYQGKIIGRRCGHSKLPPIHKL